MHHMLRKLLVQNRAMSYYAVAIGREVGIYSNWQKCEEHIKGYKGARYKKFLIHSEAEDFIRKNCVTKNTNPSLVTKVKEASHGFWPPSDGDNINENELTDKDLVAALEEYEGRPQSSTSLKRRNSKTGYTSSKRLKDESKIYEPVGLKKFGDFEFQIDSEGYVVVYTDGSCFNNGRKDACAGYGVYFGENHPLNASKPVDGRVTNNVGEIQASIHAIKAAHSMGIQKLCIFTDSRFLISSVTEWMKDWKKKNWRLKTGGPVKNIADFKELDALLTSNNMNIKWNYVAAHKGIKGNEMADRLAREGSETYKRLHKNATRKNDSEI